MERLWIAEGSTDSTRVNAESGHASMRHSASARVASIPEGWQEHDQTRRERNGRRIYRNIRGRARKNCRREGELTVISATKVQNSADYGRRYMITIVKIVFYSRFYGENIAIHRLKTAFSRIRVSFYGHVLSESAP